MLDAHLPPARSRGRNIQQRQGQEEEEEEEEEEEKEEEGAERKGRVAGKLNRGFVWVADGSGGRGADDGCTSPAI